MSRVPSILQGLPDDLLTSYVIEQRALKVSADSPLLSAALNDKAFSINASYTIAAGQSVSLNINFASKVVIRKVAVNDGISVSVTNDHGTGESDGVFSSVNLNMCSIDESPATSQLFYNATQGGQVVASGIGSIEPFIVSCEDTSPAVFVTNTTGASVNVMITVIFEELGPRKPQFGLTATTLIEPNTEMATYG